VADRPMTLLVLASYFKGERFIEQAHRRGAQVYLFTQARLLDKSWPRHALVDVFAQPDDSPLQHTLHTVAYLARSRVFDRVVALDDYDVETAAALREHLRLPGMGDTTARYFRDKLAMRTRAQEAGIPVPEFAHVLNYDNLRGFMTRVPSPWLLKPRSQASGIGMKKIHSSEDLWPWLDQLGDQQSFYLLEQFIPGRVYHVDSVVSEREIVFAEPHAYGSPPLDVSHQGGVFTTSTLPSEAAETKQVLEANRQVIEGLGSVRGVTHAEFLRSDADGKFYFLEIAARVGGAYISDVVEAASGLNLWREWARLEIGAGKQPYTLPQTRKDHAGVILCLARQEHPDTSAYADPEIVYRVNKYHHAGFVIKSPDHARVEQLINSYSQRFQSDFLASQPVPDKPTA